jgi:hypothetical protein
VLVLQPLECASALSQEVHLDQVLQALLSNDDARIENSQLLVPLRPQ